ncbi:hypothetical protein HYALB_00010777 [Hymenoscyphus albidus]|uniref:BTB domain-containing protein n=1 Tax=Hymenoscyphus albidus TaxID=595503 RepID=A0A9N9QA07_9HELO|nr:hypothetical protein HYALB_00010777 [Hymenoscyphus albidus]
MGKKGIEQPQGFVATFGVQMVDLFIGPTKQQFRVHKTLLCNRVEYFHKMFSSGFLEAEEKSGSLPDEEPIVFALFLEYLYGGGRLSPVDVTLSTQSSGPIVDRIKLYGFAERICLVELADYVMTNLISNLKHYERTPSREGILLAYKETRTGSSLRRYMSSALYYVMKYETEDSPWTAEALCETLKEVDDLLYDLIVVTRKHEAHIPPATKKSVDPRIGSKCRFHSHPENAVCLLKGDIL